MKRILFALTIALLLLTACAQAKKTLSDDILGTWVNKDGYSIEFQTGGSGFIPGVPGKIPDSTFVYSVTDESHIQVVFQGKKYTVEITINGDQLTWKDDLGEVAYTRTK